MAQVLYRKWRPRRWDQVVGQEHVVRTLHNAVAGGRVSHAYLFAGPRGTGKTSTARLLAKAVNCLDEKPANRPCDACDPCTAIQEGRFLDLIEIDAASNTSVDDVRDLRDKINFSPNQGRYKVYIIDEVHMLSTAAFNALLKTLEEPPAHAIFILATTEVHKIPATVLSRCQRHEFRRIPVTEIVAHLQALAEAEGLEIDQEVLTFIARQATGSLRDAISLVDQLASSDQGITLDLAQRVLGTATSQAVLEMVQALLASDAGRGLDLIQSALDAGGDPRQFARQLVDYLRNVLLIKMDSADQVDATSEVRARMAEHARALSMAQLLEVIGAFNRAASEIRNAWLPRLPLELAFVEALQALDGGPAPAASQPAPAARPAGPGGDKVEQADAAAADRPGPASDQGEGQAETEAEPGSLRHIARHWRQVLQVVRKRNPQTQALLNSCKPLGLKDGALLLGFSTDLLRSKMEKPENVAIAQEALAEVLGLEIPVRCVVSASASDRRDMSLGGLENDGMVAVALRDLGGEIVDIQ
jgi:DNA polymerase-3 subunit gamma/tau